MPKKKSKMTEKKLLDKKQYTKRQFNALIREGIKRQVERDETVAKLSSVQSEFEDARKAWRGQEDRMLNQITRLNQSLDFAEEEKSNLLEVIHGLGEIIGQNRSRLQNLVRLQTQTNYNAIKQ